MPRRRSGQKQSSSNRYTRTMAKEQVEAAAQKFKEVGLPLKCQGCGEDYRTNIPACPKCGIGWSSTGNEPSNDTGPEPPTQKRQGEETAPSAADETAGNELARPAQAKPEQDETSEPQGSLF